MASAKPFCWISNLARGHTPVRVGKKNDSSLAMFTTIQSHLLQLCLGPVSSGLLPSKQWSTLSTAFQRLYTKQHQTPASCQDLFQSQPVQVEWIKQKGCAPKTSRHLYLRLFISMDELFVFDALWEKGNGIFTVNDLFNSTLRGAGRSCAWGHSGCYNDGHFMCLCPREDYMLEGEKQTIQPHIEKGVVGIKTIKSGIWPTWGAQGSLY